MTDHITEKKVESEGKVFNKNRGKTVSRSKVFNVGSRRGDIFSFVSDNTESSLITDITHKYTVTITKHID